MPPRNAAPIDRPLPWLSAPIDVEGIAAQLKGDRWAARRLLRACERAGWVVSALDHRGIKRWRFALPTPTPLVVVSVAPVAVQAEV